jgi:hypothetical protein
VTKFIFRKGYNNTILRIEDHIFASTGSIDLVEKFNLEHDQTLNFIEQNPKTPAVHPVTGDQSWVFCDGRYRLFFKCAEAKEDLVIYLTDIIDNKELNLQVYPENKIPTYDEE